MPAMVPPDRVLLLLAAEEGDDDDDDDGLLGNAFSVPDHVDSHDGGLAAGARVVSVYAMAVSYTHLTLPTKRIV